MGQAGALIVTGLVCLLFGWRLYQVAVTALVVISAGIGGIILAEHLAYPIMPVALGMGVVAGLVSHWVQRLGAFFVGGAAGAIIVATARHQFTHPHNFQFTLILGVLIAGALVVILYEPGIVLATAFSGAISLVQGVFKLLDGARPGRGAALWTQHRVSVLMVFFTLVLVGLLFQTRRPRPRPDAEGPGDEPPR